MSNIEFNKESLRDIEDELKPLLIKHYEEIAVNQDKVKLSPDWGRYYTLEDMDVLKIATVRDGGKLVGYYICMVTPNLHYQDDLFSVNDIVMILPEYRNSHVGVGLFQFVEGWMKELGVSVMSVHMKVAKPFDRLCQGLGWDYTERLYTKCIKEI